MIAVRHTSTERPFDGLSTDRLQSTQSMRLEMIGSWIWMQMELAIGRVKSEGRRGVRVELVPDESTAEIKGKERNERQGKRNIREEEEEEERGRRENKSRG